MKEYSLVGLTPPWYTFFNFLKHSIGRTKCVQVLEMKELSDSNYLIQVDVKNQDKAFALATILLPFKNFGNINVRVEVLHFGQVVAPEDQILDVSELIRIFEEALDTNCYFKYVEFVKMLDLYIIFPVFKKEVIQFFNDDLSDLYRNYNGVAASVFAEVLKPQIRNIFISPSTARIRL